METRIYTEEALRGEKYAQLLRIGRNLGIKRRMKTEKLIEAILELQEELSLQQEAEAVASEVAGAAEVDKPTQCGNEEEELLTDVTCPDLVLAEDLATKDELPPAEQEVSCTDPEPGDKITVRGSRKRRRNGTYEVAREEQETIKEAAVRPKRRRTSTFDVLKKDEQTSAKCDQSSEVDDIKVGTESNVEETIQHPKRRRTSTFDVLKKDGLTGAEPEQQPSIIQSTGEDDTSQLQRHRTSTFDIAKDDEPSPVKSQPNIDITKTDQNSHELSLLVESLSKRSSGRAKLSRETILSTSKTVSVSKQSQERVTTPASARRSQAGTVADISRKSAGVPRGSKIVKPIFTVGRSDTSNKSSSGRASTNIPKFGSSARKVKVPNFAKIHERAFSRMEALDDYVDKKLKKSGSSVKKPQVSSEKVFQPTVTSVKNLNFNFVSSRSPNRVPVFSKTKTPKVENCKEISREPVSTRKSTASRLSVQTQKTPATLRNKNNPEKQTPATLKKPQNPVQKSLSTLKKASDSTRHSPATLKKPRMPTRKSPRTTSANTTSNLKSPGDRPEAAATSKTHPDAGTQHLKENVKPAHPRLENQRSAESEAKEAKHTSKIPRGKIGYQPHKGPLRTYGDREALKKLAERKPTVKSSQERRENQKRILKGVRFNKRFELQMANRGIKL